MAGFRNGIAPQTDDAIVALLASIAGGDGRSGWHQSRLSGGDVNDVRHFRHESGQELVIKQNVRSGSGMFPAEAEGLRALKLAADETGSGIVVPDVIAVEESYIAIEYLPLTGRGDGKYFRRFGRGLALLHSHGDADAGYGWPAGNFLGRATQDNRGENLDWPEFFRARRLEPLMSRAAGNGALPVAYRSRLERLSEDLPSILPANPRPALIHGDLWYGNASAVLRDGELIPAIYDPAIYRAHRDMEFGMTRLFGGFAAEFYLGYDEAAPEDPGDPVASDAGLREIRQGIYSLYHIINHLDHYGSQYLAPLDSVLRTAGY